MNSNIFEQTGIRNLRPQMKKKKMIFTMVFRRTARNVLASQTAPTSRSRPAKSACSSDGALALSSGFQWAANTRRPRGGPIQTVLWSSSSSAKTRPPLRDVLAG